MNLTAIIAFIVIFGVLVTVHEFGHFIAAKKVGVLVREFAIGMGPKLLSWRRNHTTYTIRVLPVGGYVRMAGMDEAPDLDAGQRVRLIFDAQGIVTTIDTRIDTLGEGVPFQIDRFDLSDALTLTGYRADDPDMVTVEVDHDATIIDKQGIPVQIAPRDTWVQSAKVYQRALINVAGPVMNFVLALVVFCLLGFLQPSVTLNQPIVGTVQPNMPAQQAGLRPNDQVQTINGQRIRSWEQLATTISQSTRQKLTLSVQRQGQEKTLTLIPKQVKVDGVPTRLIGITPKTYTDFGARLKYGILTTGSTTQRIWYAITHLFSGGFSLNKLGGPVSIAKTTSTVAKTGFLNLLVFMAMLSINLGMMNLIPIPALDGGKLLLNLIEAIWRRPLPENIENVVTVAGAAFMVVLMIAVTINDLLR